MITPNPATLELFKRELWKDQRQIETERRGDAELLVKHADDPEEARAEAAVLRWLGATLKTARVPVVVESSDDRIVLPYIKGIRVFNLLVELDRLDGSLSARGQWLKRRLIVRCMRNEREIQRALASMERPASAQRYAAGAKTEAIVRVLADLLGIIVSTEALQSELDLLDNVWAHEASVPFRDATTKNMVLAADDLWLGNFGSEDERTRYISLVLARQEEDKWLRRPLYDFDFASCLTLSTPEDDPISLKYHERSWLRAPQRASDVSWLGPPDPRRAALTFLVRYFRFGGRKAAYRLIHPSGHAVRFRHDNDAFYFERLPGIVTRIWPASEEAIPNLLAFARTVSRSLEGGRPPIDHFMAAGLAERRLYYVDIYPE